jgi:hypothetical protein
MPYMNMCSLRRLTHAPSSMKMEDFPRGNPHCRRLKVASLSVHPELSTLAAGELGESQGNMRRPYCLLTIVSNLQLINAAVN